MVETIAVCFAGFFQLAGCSFFFSQPADRCSPAPTLASWIFLLATLAFLWDTCIYPCRFTHMSRYWQVLVEIVAALFLTEVAMLIIWCGVESVIYSLAQLLLAVLGLGSCNQPWRFQYWLLGLLTTAVSAAMLWYILEASDGMYYVKKFVRNFTKNLRQAWRMLRCYCRMSPKARGRALKVCQLATRRKTRKRAACRPCCEDEDDDDNDEDDDDGECDQCACGK